MTDVHNEVLDQEDFDTVLSADIDFSGLLTFDRPFLIQGKVTGEINATGLLMVAEGAVVEANIRASKVFIQGTVRGNVTANERIEISATGKLTGNITTPEVAMEAGCYFLGRCSMPEKKYPQ